MAEVARSTTAPRPRTPADILPAPDQPPRHPAAPDHGRGQVADRQRHHDAAEVIGQVFAEADRRDPDQHRTWVALVDGNTHQIDRIHAEAQARDVNVTIVVDFIHVLEYLWKAAWCFYPEGDPAAETWVRDHGPADPGRNAQHRRRRDPPQGHPQPDLDPAQRKPRRHRRGATCSTRRPTWTTRPPSPGWPIATGVIEGACRHLVKDRMDITGARWGLPGAEAILKLRALLSNGDFLIWRRCCSGSPGTRRPRITRVRHSSLPRISGSSPSRPIKWSRRMWRPSRTSSTG